MINDLQCQDCQDDPECHGTCIESLQMLVFGEVPPRLPENLEDLPVFDINKFYGHKEN